MIEYDLCLYQKWNKKEHGLSSQEERLLNYLSVINIVFSSYKDTYRIANGQNMSWDTNYILNDFSEISVNEYNLLRNKSGFKKESFFKLGLVLKYSFQDRIMCMDKTYIIINFQRKYRAMIINKKIKANIIHRYWRNCSWNPKYKLARKLILIRYEKGI